MLRIFNKPLLSLPLSDLPSYVAKFRTAYDPTIPTWYSGILHFSLLNIMVGFVMLHSFYTIFGANYHAVGIYHLTTMLLLTFVFANYLEYLAHRYVLHDPHDKNHHGAVHHRYFTHNAMFMQEDNNVWQTLFSVRIVFFMFYIIMPTLSLLLELIFPTNTGYYFLAFGASYYLQYEWLHLIYHSPPGTILGDLPFIDILRKHHQVHHNQTLMREYNFNITYPIFDLILGTWFNESEPTESTQKK